MKDIDLIKQIDLGGQWEFAYTKVGAVTVPELPALPAPEAFTATMIVPGYWDDHQDRLKATPLWSTLEYSKDYTPLQFPMENPTFMSLPYIKGIGWYKRNIKVPVGLSSQRVSLHIGGVRMSAWVWLNGDYLGKHDFHTTSFNIELENLHSGQPNELVIAVSNVHSDREGCDLWGYKGRTGGISGPVYLRTTGRTHIGDLHIFPEGGLGEISWQVTLEGETAGAVLEWAIND